MYVCYSRSKNESHAKAVLYHLENWGFTMPEEDGEKNIMREVTYEQECESIARHQEAVVVTGYNSSCGAEYFKKQL